MLNGLVLAGDGLEEGEVVLRQSENGFLCSRRVRLLRELHPTRGCSFAFEARRRDRAVLSASNMIILMRDDSPERILREFRACQHPPIPVKRSNTRTLGFFELLPEVAGELPGFVCEDRESAGGADGAFAASSFAEMSRARCPELASRSGVSSVPVEGLGTEGSCPYSLVESFLEVSFTSSNLFFALLKNSSFSGTEVSRCSFLQSSPREQVRFFAGW